MGESLIRCSLLVCFALVVFVPFARADYTIRWRSMDVKAFLDSYGLLQVHEEFTLELDGNWEVLDRRFPSSPGSQQYEQRYPGSGLAPLGAKVDDQSKQEELPAQCSRSATHDVLQER